MVRFTILHSLYLNDLPVNGRGFHLPEKQVIRNGAIKNCGTKWSVFYCGVERREPLRVERGVEIFLSHLLALAHMFCGTKRAIDEDLCLRSLSSYTAVHAVLRPLIQSIILK